MLKKYIALTVTTLGLLISTSMAEYPYQYDQFKNFFYCETHDSIRITSTIYVESVDNYPIYDVTQYHVKDGASLLIDNQVFSCDGTLSESLDLGRGHYNYNGHRIFVEHYWVLPLYCNNPRPSNKIFVGNNTRVIGVPSSSTISVINIYQVVRGDRLVFIFTRGKLLECYYNPKPTIKFPKHYDFGVICQSVPASIFPTYSWKE